MSSSIRDTYTLHRKLNYYVYAMSLRGNFYIASKFITYKITYKFTEIKSKVNLKI